MSLSVSDAIRHASYSNEPRELNDDEMMAADEDGDQLLLFHLPEGASRRYGTQQDPDVYRMLRQRQEQVQDESLKVARTSGVNGVNERRAEQSKSILIDNNRALNISEIGANHVSSNRLNASKYSNPMTISTAENWSLDNDTIENGSPLSPRSNADTLSPSGSTSGSGRRSALPVPVRYIASASRSKQLDSESPTTTTNVPQSLRPTSTNVRHSKNESQSPFVRRDVTRASMFERGSRPHITSSAAAKASRNVVNSAKQSGVHPTPRRSVSPPPSFNRPSPQTKTVSPVEDLPDGVASRRGVRIRPPPIDTRPQDRRWTVKDEMTSPSFNRDGNFDRVITSNASLNTVSSEHPENINSADDTSIWNFRLTVTDVGDILTGLSSSEWTDRRDALASLQSMFKTNACISLPDLKRITDIFTRMFHDPQKKVFAMLADILTDFFYVHADDLDYWIPTALPRLFVKIGGADVRGSVQSKIQRALDTARDTFNLDVQIETIVNFMTEQSHLQGVKTKEAILSYLHELVLNMDTDDLVNTPAIRSLLLRVVLWASEAQSPEIRKEALAIVPAMFSVNAPEFSLVMMSQPKGVQDMVERILKSHMRTTQGIVDEPISPVGNASLHRPLAGQQLSRQTQLPNNRKATRSVSDPQAKEDTPKRIPAQSPNFIEKARIISSPSLKSPSITETSSAGRAPVERRQLLSADSGVAVGDWSPDVKVVTPIRHVEVPESPKTSDDISRSNINSSPAQKPTLQACIGDIPVEICINDSPADCAKWWNYIVETLSSNIASCERRKVAIRQMIDSMPNNPGTISPSGINTIMALLLSTTSINDEVSILALECAAMLLDSVVHPALKCRVLGQLSELGVQPINLAALKLLQVTLNTVDDEVLNRCLKELVNSLLKVYEDDDRSVRKAGVDILVYLFVRVGDQLWLFITGLGDAKTNFLKTRFRRAVVSHSSGREDTLS